MDDRTAFIVSGTLHQKISSSLRKGGVEDNEKNRDALMEILVLHVAEAGSTDGIEIRCYEDYTYFGTDMYGVEIHKDGTIVPVGG